MRGDASTGWLFYVFVNFAFKKRLRDCERRFIDDSGILQMRNSWWVRSGYGRQKRAFWKLKTVTELKLDLKKKEILSNILIFSQILKIPSELHWTKIDRETHRTRNVWQLHSDKKKKIRMKRQIFSSPLFQNEARLFFAFEEEERPKDRPSAKRNIEKRNRSEREKESNKYWILFPISLARIIDFPSFRANSHEKAKSLGARRRLAWPLASLNGIKGE